MTRIQLRKLILEVIDIDELFDRRLWHKSGGIWVRDALKPWFSSGGKGYVFRSSIDPNDLTFKLEFGLKIIKPGKKLTIEYMEACNFKLKEEIIEPLIKKITEMITNSGKMHTIFDRFIQNPDRIRKNLENHLSKIITNEN